MNLEYYAKEIAELTANETVPCLLTRDGTMKETEYILKYLA